MVIFNRQDHSLFLRISLSCESNDNVFYSQQGIVNGWVNGVDYSGTTL